MRALVLVLVLVGCNGKEDAPTDTPDTDPGDTDSGDDDDGPALRFEAHLVDGAATSVRHATYADVDGDGVLEIIAALTGPPSEGEVKPGRVVLYDLDGALDSWVRTDLVPESANVLQPNEPLAHDVDDDGDLDVIVAAGSPFCEPLPTVESCGAIVWVENDAGAWTVRPIVSGSPLIFTSVALADIDDDGILDLVTCAEDLDLAGAASVTVWYQGLGDSGGFRSNFAQIGVGGGPWPTIHDVDADGDEDIVVGERTGATTFSWFEQVAPPGGGSPGGTWAKHTIDDANGPGWMIRFVPDLVGDGRTIAVATNHTNTVRTNEPDPWPSAVLIYEPGADPRQPWSATPISTGIEAIQDLQLFPMEAPGGFDFGDIDADGDVDLAVAGDGDPTVYLLDQTAPGAFETRVLREGIPRNGGAVIDDLEGDGGLEILVTGQIDNAVYVIDVVTE